MRGVLALLAVGAALSVALTGGALAYGGATARYSPDGSVAELIACGVEGGMVQVYGEQPDGSYCLVASTAIGPSGEASLIVPATGPMKNGQPQFQVMICDPAGPVCVAIADKEYAFD